MKYVICPVCGSNLDHGEICDCTKKKAETDSASDRKYRTEKRRFDYGLSQGTNCGANVKCDERKVKV